MITIDGSLGEGGGQILRTSLALSMLTGQPFKMVHIRSRRPKSGMLRQHLTCVQAALQVCSGEAEGAAMGSMDLTFTPGEIKNGAFQFSVGTAGSTTLVLQTILPALITAQGASSIILEGGTHNSFAPPFNFLEKSFVPLINRMGPKVRLTLERHGFYPAGGGKVCVEIEPANALSKFDLKERGELVSTRGEALYSHISKDIARRELEVLQRKLFLESAHLECRKVTDSPGPGNLVSVTVESEQVTEVFTGFGEKGRSAEKVAGKACQETAQYLNSGAAVGPYLADQLLLPFALAGGGEFSTTPPQNHTVTNAEVIQQFLEVNIDITQVSGKVWTIRIG